MVVIYHPDYATHIQFKHHPESPFRMEYIMKKIAHMGLSQEVMEPSPAEEEDVLAVHEKKYCDFIRTHVGSYLDGETIIREGTYDVAMLAAGGAVTASEESFLRNKPSFAVVRPPGHHAGPDYGGGFCYFNNVAIAAKRAMKRSHRVAIIDIDAHHGNGTQEIFYESNEVLYVSLHEWGIFPGTGNYNEVGAGKGKGYTVNIPLPAHSGDTSYAYAFEKIIMPILNQFMPSAIFVSIGVDAHYRDNMSRLELSSRGYLDIAEKLGNFAREYCSNRVIYVLEGGYSGVPLSEVVGGIISLFEGKTPEIQYTDIKDRYIKGRDYINKSKKALSHYWKV